MTDMELRYPIGRPKRQARLDPGERAELIAEIGRLPALLRSAAALLSEEQWSATYRPGGWTGRQVIHHLADSHLNFYARVRLLLTEDSPTIKPYREALWAELADARDAPPEVSLALLDALHARLGLLLTSLPPEAFARELLHPDQDRPQSLDEMLTIYSWHGLHHVEHLKMLASSAGNA
jgi:hypothetical protein